MIGHRSPRSSCGTTCLTVPRSGNCCPWPTRLTCRCLPGARLPKDGSPANTSVATPPTDRGWTPLHPSRQRRHRPRRRRHLPRNRLLTRAGSHFLGAAATRLGHPVDRGPHRRSVPRQPCRHRRAPQPAAPGPARRTQPSHARVPRGCQISGLSQDSPHPRQSATAPASHHA